MRYMEWRRLWPQWAMIAVAAITGIGIRRALRPHITSDYTVYMVDWWNQLQAQGFAGLGEEIGNYNTPFLYLLLAGTVLPWDGLYVIKLIAASFDVIMAVGVGAIVWTVKRNSLAAAFAGVTTFLAPEVLLNSGLWGQLDSMHTAAIVWTLFFIIRGYPLPAWVLYFTALQFKTQAIFFLPVMFLAFIWQKHRWWTPLAGLVAGLLWWVPALIAGRSPASLVGIFINHTRAAIDLQLNAANLYQWVPNSLFDLMNPAGVLLAVGVFAVVTARYLTAPTALLQTAAVYGLLAPFLLPQMHDRYFYAGTVVVLVCALLDRRYWAPAAVLQFTAVVTYGPMMGLPATVMPMPVIAAIQLAAIGWVYWLSLTPLRGEEGVLVGDRVARRPGERDGGASRQVA